MVTETNEYKGRRFKCSVCDGVVSSSAMSDFDVDDFYFCPFCGSTGLQKHNKENFDETTRRVLVDRIENIIADFDARQMHHVDLEELNREELICISECLQFGQLVIRLSDFREELLKNNRIGRKSLEAFLEIAKKYGLIN